MPRPLKPREDCKHVDNMSTSVELQPSRAPHFGGALKFVKSLVKSAKCAINRILSQRTLTDEVLVTAFCIVENLLNGRPLIHLTNDAMEAEAI